MLLFNGDDQVKFLSQVYTAVSGSVNGLTYSRNRYGMYTRGRATPVNPQSTRQTAVRTAFAAMVVYWSETLTAAERAAWDTYAANTPVTDALGQTQYLTGQSMFIRANSIRQRLGLSIIDAAPTSYDLGEPPTNVVSVTVAGGILTLTFDVGGAGTSTTATKLVRIGVAQNAGRTFFAGPYQLAITGSCAAAVSQLVMAPTLAGADWLADYQPSVADRIPFDIRFLYDDGRLSVAHREIITIT